MIQGAYLRMGLKGMYNAVDVIGKEVKPQSVGANTAGNYSNTSFGNLVKDSAKIF